MRVREIMEKNPITFRPTDTLHKALTTFTDKGISGAPVVSKGKLVGIVSELDIIKVLDIYTPRVHFSSMPQFFLVLAGLKSKKKTTELRKRITEASKISVGEFMTRDVISVGADADIMEATRIIDTYRVNRLPVIDRGKVVGILTRDDIIKAVAKLDGELCAERKK